ncbi:DsbA family protein [Marinobacter sp. F3R08]|uniref:DsbA family protein n=1 Tax=Marinobacter sp. F3R08 TaxID=2841559 RepID=UPI001C0811A1|nr:DsbA family protein [Marinobacter sp. F3R08]MBU2952298.1 DsbA family protein [Marinobacter sp. F3R08]
MSNPSKATSPSSPNKVLMAVIVAGVFAAIVLSIVSFNTAKQNQGEMKAVTAALEKQTEMMAQMQGTASSQELVDTIRSEMEEARREEMLRPFKAIAGSFANAKEELQNVEPGSEIYGSESAEVSIVEFSDFDCPYCKRFHETPKDVVDQSGGRVNWVWKHFPVHASARPLHEATECVARQNNKLFWIATQLIFDEGGSRGIKPADLGGMLPLDQQAYQECLNGREAKLAVQEDYNFGQEAGVTGTPATYVIHNRTNQVLQLKGAVPANRVMDAVQQLVDAANAQNRAQSEG